MITVTSAYANKLIKQLEEDKSFWLQKEEESQVYNVSMGEEPLIPEYDYLKVANTIAEIDEKICKIKHAINLHNATSTVTVGDEEMTIDTILVKMAQMNRRKKILDCMRKRQEKTRLNTDMFGGRNTTPEYQYINYDLELVKQEYEKVSEFIMNMQMALDVFNQIHTFEIDI
ncbi:MAG: hypothetical protein IKJ01_06675 [Lachnospiraceae bacterium]|nr:hypothetical protein [Lachnospiraceae bacterium]